MWGFFVESAGVGPKACPVNNLTPELLAKALADLASPRLQSKAVELSKQMALEDGVQGGYVHFIDCLPRENLLCDVSLLLGESVLARYTLVGTSVRQHGIKVSSEVAALLELDNNFNLNSLLGWCPTRKVLTKRQIWAVDIRRHAVTNYNVSGHISSFHHGFFAAFIGLILGAMRAAMQLFWKADQWARRQGALGCIFGLAISPLYIFALGLFSVVIFFDRLAVGIANGCFGKQFHFIFDPSRKARVHDTPPIQVEKEAFVTHGIPKARRGELHKSLEMVVKAQIVFRKCKPVYPEKHMHFLVVKLNRLTEYLKSPGAKRHLDLTPREVETVVKRLSKNSLPSPTAVRRHTVLHSTRQFLEDGLRKLSIPTVIKEGSGEIVSEELREDSTSRNEGDHSERESLGKDDSTLRNFVTHLNPLNFLTKKKPEDTDISFSHFIYALQPVSKDKYLHLSRRRSAVSLRQNASEELGASEDFAEFMS